MIAYDSGHSFSGLQLILYKYHTLTYCSTRALVINFKIQEKENHICQVGALLCEVGVMMTTLCMRKLRCNRFNNVVTHPAHTRWS